MASYNGAIARIHYLAGLGPARSTPETITGADRDQNNAATSIYSYGLKIAWKDRETGQWTVTDKESTPTTNRHIRAAHWALAN